MAQVAKNVQNDFIAGLKTEYTALNFPENAAIDTSNCVYTLIGDVNRRGGINYEANSVLDTTTVTSNSAVNTYKWNNVGGDGLTQMVVAQFGGKLLFYKSSATTTSSSLSAQELTTIVTLNPFVASGGSLDITQECQFADGNGYLFVFHPSCDPFYCSFNPANNQVTAAVINIQIRDFNGFYPEPGNPPTTFRPQTLNIEHNYNLVNQGWTQTPSWTASSNDTNPGNFTGGFNSQTIAINQTSLTFNVQKNLSLGTLPSVADISVTFRITDTGGNNVLITLTGKGTVSAYNAGSGVLSITVTSSTSYSTQPGYLFNSNPINPQWTFVSDVVNSTITAWNTGTVSVGGYPSNADIWFTFKASDGSFNPAKTIANVGLPTTQAPLGHFILSAFNQNFSNVSGISGLTSITTTARPKTGCWFQGRVWYSGVDASQVSTGDQNYYTWTESIYFSQIGTGTTPFGKCYQDNDPTSENFFDLLPSDGGVIVIQGSGSIYKLFPVQNGLLVFAANGIWFITGSTGIGFAANDYTITKISGIQPISATSFVNVLGWPVFWNSEGIYEVTPNAQGAGLQVNNLVIGNITSFYNNIPAVSKLYARGDYDPISYQIQWCYRSTLESGIANRYKYDSILVHNTVEIRQGVSKAFYPYSISTGNYPTINGIRFVQNPGGGPTAPPPIFKYLVSSANGITWAEENDFSRYVDWFSFDNVGADFTSFFTTGYNLKPQHHPYYGYFSQALVKHSVSFIEVISRNTSNNSYLFSSIWDWAASSRSGKFSSQQQVTNNLSSSNYSYIRRRHRVRGRGHSVQFQFKSVSGQPMDIVGWSVFESILEAP